jgi:hypothetical protein
MTEHTIGQTASQGRIFIPGFLFAFIVSVADK